MKDETKVVPHQSAWRWLSRVLYLASAVSGLATALFGYLFYFYYWQWRGLFNEEGRYFYEPDSVVFHDESAFLILPTIGCAVIFALFVFGARASRRRVLGNGV